MLFVSRLPHLSQQEFKDYYESKHVPLVHRLMPMIDGYERNYPDYSIFQPKLEPDADAVVVFRFADRAKYDSWRALVSDPDVIQQVRGDEAKFLQTSKQRIFMVEECQI